MSPHPFSQEIHNRWQTCSPEQRRDPAATIIRITVEVTYEWLQQYPEAVAEFLKFAQLPSGSTH